MDGKWMFRFVVCVTVFGGCAAASLAAPPWGDLISLKSVAADPEQTYQINENNGPWTILACSFSGEGAEKQANELVYELRKRYKLPAYVHKAGLDLGDAAGKGSDELGNPRKFKYFKQQKRHVEVQEVAVLVGDYRSAEDSEAQKTLKKIKLAQPQCLEVKEGQTTHQTLTGWRMIQKQVYEAIGSDKKKLGPMGHAFITTNPLLPPDYFAPKNGVDPDIIALNQGVPYDLLDCPGKFTVRVATFKGNAVIKPEEIRAIEDNSQEMKSGLPAAAEKAHAMTLALREKGYDAYQFHDRYGSIVCVGSFNSVGTQQPDGQISFSQQVLDVVKFFGPNGKVETPESVQKTVRASGLDNQVSAMRFNGILHIPYDVQPTPVQVPKRSLSMALRGEE